MTTKRRAVLLSWLASMLLAVVLASAWIGFDAAWWYYASLAVIVALGVLAEVLRQQERRAEARQARAAYRAVR